MSPGRPRRAIPARRRPPGRGSRGPATRRQRHGVGTSDSAGAKRRGRRTLGALGRRNSHDGLGDPSRSLTFPASRPTSPVSEPADAVPIRSRIPRPRRRATLPSSSRRLPPESRREQRAREWEVSGAALAEPTTHSQNRDDTQHRCAECALYRVTNASAWATRRR